MPNLLTEVVDSLIFLLLVATGVALLTQWLRIPYVIGLVLAGLVIPRSLLPGALGLNPDLVLNLFLPILIFEAALNTDISRLRSTLKPIALLAGPGVIFSALLTTFLLQWGLQLPWITAAATSVILTITDTVSVIAAFRSVPVPSRLATIVEGESLFNDGVAMVLLSVITTIHLEGTFSLGSGIREIFIAFGGGGLVGVGLGYLCVGLFQQLDDGLSNILLTVAVSLGTFQVGQTLGVSSAIAVLTAGLVIGNLGFEQTSGTLKVSLMSFWEYAGFGVNTFIFLLVGIETEPKVIVATLPAALFTIFAYQAGRIATIYPLIAFVNRIDRPIPLPWQHILIVGNIKGSLSMALALGLPFSLPDRGRVITLVFSTVFLSFIGQGLSLPWWVKRLKLFKPSALRQRVAQLQLHLISAKAAQTELGQLLQVGSIPKFLYEELFASYQAKIAQAEMDLRTLYNQRWQSVGQEGESGKILQGLWRRLYLAEKAAINTALGKGLLTEEAAKPYLKTLNDKLLALKDEEGD